ncbi:MAG: hypothetical protein WC781_03530 [Candidatus Pacearchaeota archaeon]|jgi:hypothetical protein
MEQETLERLRKYHTYLDKKYENFCAASCNSYLYGYSAEGFRLAKDYLEETFPELKENGIVEKVEGELK